MLSTQLKNHINEWSKGLSNQEVIERQELYGKNKLPERLAPTAWSILLSQFKSPLIYIILIAAVISLIMGEISDFAIISAVIVIDVILGFYQEYQAEKTYLAMKGLLKPTTTVVREGKRIEIEVGEVVKGDIVLLTMGEHVPADGEILESQNLIIDESILTGESIPINKSAEKAQNLAFMGTIIIGGKGVMRVNYIGIKTELGKIAKSLQEHVEEDTPLQIRLKAFSKTLTLIVSLFTMVIFFSGLVMGKNILEMLETAIILAIAAVPEGLLIAVTVILVLGMRVILKRNGLVKKLLAVETLGSVTTICTDKTGTLTEGKMTVVRAEFLDPDLAFKTMVLCNNLEGPVETALWDYASGMKFGDPQVLFDRSKRIIEDMFTSEKKYMETTNLVDQQELTFLKGAPEIVLEMCSHSSEEKQIIINQINNWADDGLRLLGLAYKVSQPQSVTQDFKWIGLMGFDDPIREGVSSSIETARCAGISTIMITGDYYLTAERVAKNLGLISAKQKILDGADFNHIDDVELRTRVKDISVFSRIRPNDKLRIVQALQHNGEIIAMVGDGVNDAPALQRANIGVVVDSATDVAKETADLILLDNNFRTIVAAIKEGRVIFDNIQKVVAYTLSNSFAEVMTIFIAMLLKWPAPLTVAQILWIHLICDGPSDIVLGFEPAEKGVMDQKPKSLKEPILTRLGASLIGLISVSSTIFALSLFKHFFQQHGNPVEGRSIVFASFAVNSMIYIFSYRNLKQSIFNSGNIKGNLPLVWAVAGGLLMAIVPFTIPFLRNLLDIVQLNFMDWLMVFGVALFNLTVVEIGKLITRISKKGKLPNLKSEY
ncbi:MAG: cation-translocating P-type ATPase [Anaerolineales bacterium]|nr:cation-translocating P-type ATPase [Anaerolineales bacterium]